MKTTITILIAIAIFLYLSKVSISFNPFKVRFEDLSMAFAWLLFFASVGFYAHSIADKEYKKGYSKGLDRGIEISREVSVEAAKQIIEEYKQSNN